MLLTCSKAFNSSLVLSTCKVSLRTLAPYWFPCALATFPETSAALTYLSAAWTNWIKLVCCADGSKCPIVETLWMKDEGNLASLSSGLAIFFV